MSLLCFLAFSLYKKIESVEIERSETIYYLLKALNIKGSSQIFWNVQLKRQRVVDVLIETLSTTTHQCTATSTQGSLLEL